eukprot:6183500-Pleurochrysis_carterae.AAC.1
MVAGDAQSLVDADPRHTLKFSLATEAQTKIEIPALSSGAVIWWLGSKPGSSFTKWVCWWLREAVGIETLHSWFVPREGVMMRRIYVILRRRRTVPSFYPSV